MYKVISNETTCPFFCQNYELHFVLNALHSSKVMWAIAPTITTVSDHQTLRTLIENFSKRHGIMVINYKLLATTYGLKTRYFD